MQWLGGSTAPPIFRKLILLDGFDCLPLMSALAGGNEGKLVVDEVVSRALASNQIFKASGAKWAAMKERVPLRKIGTFRRQYELTREKLLSLARRTTETLRINYEADKATFTAVLTVQRMSRDAEAAASMQLADYLAALAELEALVGGDPVMPDSSKSSPALSKRREP